MLSFPVIAIGIGISLAQLSQSPETERPDLSGFWKTDCRYNFGVRIEPAGADLYSLSFCGPGGCFEPGTWRPNSPLYGDNTYRILSKDAIQLPFGDGFETYVRCPGGQAPAEAAGDQPPAQETPSGLHFKAYYEDLPDLDQDPPFAGGRSPGTDALRALIARPGEGQSKVPCPAGEGAREICGEDAQEAYRLLGRMTHGLPSGQFSKLWLADLDGDNVDELIAQFDAAPDGSSDRYAAFFVFRWEGKRCVVTSASWFLEGSLHAIADFGPTTWRKVFLRFASCTECHPWIYLMAFDPFVLPIGAAFDFSYALDETPESWNPEIEYTLPGMGHSIDAEVETRLPERPTPAGPHLLQHFKVEGGEDEWWSFTCLDHRCRPQVFKGAPPPPLLEEWKKAKHL
jgi:hypothetical protein